MIVVIILIHACVGDIPLAVRDFAISAICDFPPLSGNNMCRDAEVIRFVEEDAITSSSVVDNNEKCWCVEVVYVDYTGESGFASLWVIESTTAGDYILYKGPMYNVKCDRVQ
jgi:hypothetical protein